MRRALICLLVAACLGSAPPAPAQQENSAAQDRPEQRAEQPQPPRDTPATISLRSLPKNVLLDQKAFWTMPTRFRARDSQWLLPAALVTAIAIGSDTAVERRMPTSPSQLRRSQRIADAGLLALAGTAGGMFLWGRVKRNDRLAETGLLAGEALADTLAVTMTMKAMAGRERPGEGGGRGRFAAGGDSFPSEHAALSWTLASVLAHRYPGRLTRILAYGTAAGVSAARVAGRKHFASDVLIGSALGWYMGRQVVRARGSDRDPDTANWGMFVRGEDGAGGGTSIASPYVPLDSWVYPAFDRLSALGYLQTGFAGQRPWTRRECARLVEEAGELLDEAESSANLARLHAALQAEFAPELAAEESGGSSRAEIESLYLRTTGISGAVLRDGYHFGQTLVNDYGRPYGEGVNLVAGLSAYAQSGPFAVYVRGEYQRAPGLAPWPPAVESAIAAADFVPAAPVPPSAAVSRFRLVEGYVSLQWRKTTFSFGRQSLWWGAGQGGPLLLSDNAEPLAMLRVDQSEPVKLPSIFGRLGPMRTQFFLGQLSGQQFVNTPSGIVGTAGRSFDPQPYIHGEKVSFRPTPNLEFAFSRTVLFGGPSFPVTLSTFWNSLVSRSTLNNLRDPGDRRSGFEFTYRVPGMRDWVQVYLDSFTDDEVSPVAFPTHAAWNPGVYLAQIPGLRRLDFRAEGFLTPARAEYFPGFYYYNVRYHAGYTNEGLLLGNWIGRQGKGVQLWSTWWFSPQDKVQAGYRQMEVDRAFLQGGRLEDFSVAGQFRPRPNLSVSASLQYERWNFPLLAAGPQANVVATVQLTYWPHWRIK